MFKQKNPLKYTEAEEKELHRLTGKKHSKHEAHEKKEHERKEHKRYW